MSGHSKWATTKHRKGAQDAKRSALFSKLSRNITVAARLGNDPNPDNNASLAAAVAKAVAKGDGEVINGILRQVLSTEEGRRVAQKINEAMK